MGFLKYWTLSNLPLFLLAAPMLTIMIVSSHWAWTHVPGYVKEDGSGRKLSDNDHSDYSFTSAMLRYLTIPQALLGVLALTTYHVQIITRLSSGYPVWYWWLASLILGEEKFTLFGRQWHIGGAIVRWMVVYALIQAGLFASFLPPA